MKTGFEKRLADCVTQLTGSVVKGVTVDGGLVAVELVPERGTGSIPLAELPEVLKVGEVDVVKGTVSLIGQLDAVKDYVQSWNMDTDDPRIRRFVAQLRRDTRCEVTHPEFRNGEFLYELTVPTLDFTAPDYVYIEGVDFRSRILYCYTFMEDMNRVLETAAPDPVPFTFQPSAGKLKN